MAKKDTSKFDQAEKKRYLKGRITKASNMLGEFYDKEDIQTSMQDALTDFLHTCLARDWDFYEMLEKAKGHFHHERKHGEHG